MTRTFKQARHELDELLAEELGVAIAAYGAPVNPPCIQTRPANYYVEAIGYCQDRVQLETFVLPGAGEGEATVDALDDLIEQVRSALLTPLSDGFKFSFRAVRMLPPEEAFGAVIDITYERNDD